MNEWMLLGIILSLIGATHIVRYFLLTRMETRQEIWRILFIKSLYPPLQTLLMTLLAAIALQLLDHYISITPYILPFFKQILIPLTALWFLLRFIRESEKSLQRFSHGMDPTTIKATSQFVRVTALLAGLLMILQSFGIPLAGVLAFGGVGGIAVGFAAKDLLSNFFGGLMLFLDRPFKLGETIRSDAPTFEGIVEQIGWRYTRIRTLERTPLFIPNSIFSTIALENLSRRGNRKIQETFHLRYEDLSILPSLIHTLNQVLHHSPLIDPTRPAYVRLAHIGPLSLEIEVQTYTRATEPLEFQQAQEELLLQLLTTIHQSGAQHSYPYPIRNH